MPSPALLHCPYALPKHMRGFELRKFLLPCSELLSNDGAVFSDRCQSSCVVTPPSICAHRACKRFVVIRHCAPRYAACRRGWFRHQALDGQLKSGRGPGAVHARARL